MKRILLLILIFCSLGIQAQTLPSWQQGWFDIHHISTGKGECQFLVFPDGTTMVIDCGDMTGQGKGWAHSKALPDSSKTPPQWAARYIDTFSPTPGRIDYVLISHFHSDHMGHISASKEGPHGYRLSGITELAEYERIGTLVDRGYPRYDYPSVEVVEKQCAMMADYKKFVTFKTINEGMKAEQFKLGSKKQFRTQSGAWDFKVWNVAVNLKAVKKGRLFKKEENILKFDENMFSCVQLFTYGPFKYYSGGDFPGSNLAALKFERYYETPVADIVGKCDVVKADHHGYRDSTNPYFLWKTEPDAIIVDAAEASHPRRETVERITDPQYRGRRDIYTTSEAGRAKMGEDAWNKIKGTGHIVVRVYEGGKSWQVFVLDAASTYYHVLQSSEVYQTRKK